MKTAELVQMNSQDDRAELTLFVPPSLCYFLDHFAIFPLLPGVVQIEWAVQYAQRCFALVSPTQRLEQVKFQAPIKPSDTVQLTLQFEREKNRVLFHYDSARGRHSSGRIVFN
jgi:3-hydroxymyristoyl/3-hydroxydecanoyl-(acyl carrier protein) dehydratase